MALNDCRDEAGAFLRAIGEEAGPPGEILAMLDEEMTLLRESVDDGPRLRHQTYDVLFLLFELAARLKLDLDAEWDAGRRRKRDKYLEEDV